MVLSYAFAYSDKISDIVCTYVGLFSLVKFSDIVILITRVIGVIVIIFYIIFLISGIVASLLDYYHYSFILFTSDSIQSGTLGVSVTS